MPALLILLAVSGCHKDTSIVGCTIASASNYSPQANSPNNSSCQYSGNAIFYLDAPMPAGYVIQATLANSATIQLFYDSTGVPQCGGSIPLFTQGFTGNDSLIATYTASTGASYCKWQGSVTFKPNNCAATLLSAGNVVFYTPDTNYVNSSGQVIVISLNGSSSDSRYIPQVDSSAPAFGHTICDFYLPPGNYTYSATTSGPNTPVTWSGSFSVDSDRQYKAIKLL